MNETQALAAFAATLCWADLPAPTQDSAKRVLLDGLASLMSGAQSETGRAAATLVLGYGGRPEAQIFAAGRMGQARDAAYANAMALYSAGLNDIHKPSGTHPAGTVLPAALACAQRDGASGADFLAALVAGYEVNGRIGRAMKPGHRARGFHPTGTCGTLGAAAAAARIGGLRPDAIASVLGIAGSQAAGLYAFHARGDTTMIFHAGRAAQNGVEAVLIEASGITGPRDVLEGHQGLCAAMTSEARLSEITDGLGSQFMIDETSLRPCFGCNSTKSTSLALAAVTRGHGIAAREVAAVTLRVHPLPACDNDLAEAATLLQARLSLQCNAALVLLHGDVLRRDLSPADLDRSELHALMRKVRVMADADLDRYECKLAVTLSDGSVYEHGDRGELGDPGMPLDWEAVAGKTLSAGGTERLVAAVLALDGGDLTPLFEALDEARDSCADRI